MFEPLPAKFDFPQAEQRVLEFWERHDVFGRSLTRRREQGAERFVFYEGPPTANGLPHPGHCLTRAMKDLFPRYRTMCGFLCERKAGWDTHGLPVEVEVCKELGIHTKEEIEAYGVERFVRKCVESVWRYTREWEYMTRRLGFWVNLDQAYATYHKSYVESVWWSLKTLFDRGLLYQGHKVVWWWAQGGTALSSGEVGEGYRTVDDPSVYVRFPLIEGQPLPGMAGGSEGSDEGVGGTAISERCSLLVWTTTPWTLISNHFAAVHPNLRYALVRDPVLDEYLYIAADLVEAIGKKLKREYETVGTCEGRQLFGLRYVPPFRESYYDRATRYTSPRLGSIVEDELPFSEFTSPTEQDYRHLQRSDAGATIALHDSRLERSYVGWRVVLGLFVTTESGTGLVHEAPPFGEVDFDLWKEHSDELLLGLPLLNAVNPDGTFNSDAPEQYRGRWVKECDKDIIRELKERGLLYHQETYRHEYPFCPRAENDPLIQYARKSWFVRTSRYKQEFLANNAAINWLPEHIKEGRFGDFLRNNVDWALSRERYWGTPLPIWQCEACGRMEAVGSFEGLRSRAGATDGGFWERMKAEHPEMPDDLRVHKPYIDEWTYECGVCGGEGTEQGTGREREIERSRDQEGGARTNPKSKIQNPKSASPRMRRVPEVIDCWWDAGSMPFAQWGYPHAEDSARTLDGRFPADFISEAIDQTRGWFYGLLAINTLLFSEAAAEREARRDVLRERDGGAATDPKAFAAAKSIGEAESSPAEPSPVSAARRQPEAEAAAIAGGGALAAGGSAGAGQAGSRVLRHFPIPYRTCIVLGHMMGEDGLKMSKRTKNYREPSYIFDHYGADAMRWYFFSAQTPWTSARFQEANIRDSQREFLVRLYNVFSFFNIYANIDGFEVRHEGTEARRHEGGVQSSALHEGNQATEPRSDEGEHRRPAGASIGREGSGGRYSGSDRRSDNTVAAPSEREAQASAAPEDVRSPVRVAADQSKIQNPESKIAGTGWRPVAERSELDRWIVGELHRTIRFVREKMDAFENFPAAGRLNDFVDALSNWYVRRSRERFWKPVEGTEARRHEGTEGKEPGTANSKRASSPIPDPRSPIPAPDQDKWDAYNTLYEVLLTLCKLIAPFTPFFAEMVYQNLTGSGIGDQGTGKSGTDGRDNPIPDPRSPIPASSPIPDPRSPIPLSVHLCDYPQADAALIDEQLAAEMDIVRELVSLGRAARTAAKLKVRQPLALVEVILARHEYEQWLRSHAPLIAEELNVKQVDFATQADHYVSYQIKPDFKAIGPKFGKLAPQIAKALQSIDAAAARQKLADAGELPLQVGGETVLLSDADVQIRLEAKPGWSAAPGRAGVVVVKTELTPELLDEGLIRELIHHVQGLRKELDLPYQARITLYVQTDEKLAEVIRRFEQSLRQECLVEQIAFEASSTGVEMREFEIESHKAQLGIK